jgi:hypothetical protein
MNNPFLYFRFNWVPFTRAIALAAGSAGVCADDRDGLLAPRVLHREERGDPPATCSRGTVAGASGLRTRC